MSIPNKPPARAMRVYEPIWVELKKLHYASGKPLVRLAQNKKLHARTIKGTSKERYHDIAFRLELSEIDKRAELRCKSMGNILELSLIIVDRPLGVNDL